MSYRSDLGSAALEGTDYPESLHFIDCLDPRSLEDLISKINTNPTSNEVTDRHVNSSTRSSSTTSNETSSSSVGNQSNQPYRDFSTVSDEFVDKMVTYRTMQGRPKEAFPLKLHKILESSDDEDYSSIISWLPHGRAFKVHDRDRFIKSIMQQHFYMTRITSFQRQLNIYGFRKCKKGADKGGYCHELFLRGRPGLCSGIVRLKFKPKFNPENEPNFYELPPVSEARTCSTASNENPSNGDHQELKSHSTTKNAVFPEASPNKESLNNMEDKVSKYPGRNIDSNLSCIHATKHHPLFGNNSTAVTSQMAFGNTIGLYSTVESRLLNAPCVNNLSATTHNELLISRTPRHYLSHPMVHHEQSSAYTPSLRSAVFSPWNEQIMDKICNGFNSAA